MIRRGATAALAMLAFVAAVPARSAESPVQSCFMLSEVGAGEVFRDPVDACRLPLSPGATFHVLQALVALESGAVTSTEAPESPGDAAPVASPETLSSAFALTVDGYFQRLAARVGRERTRVYLQMLQYGNKDPGPDPRTTASGGVLRITAEEQQDFLVRLYQGDLDVSATNAASVRALLVQPDGALQSATGTRPFAAPWPAGVVVSARRAEVAERGGRQVRWLIGHVVRDGTGYVFVSCVVGGPGLGADAAIELADERLKASAVL